MGWAARANPNSRENKPVQAPKPEPRRFRFGLPKNPLMEPPKVWHPPTRKARAK